ncbi:fused FliR family export protein/FlhB family type III secretion system protein [Romboutsia timonensis]|uniref:fused FliR family export protein/FlhB family type III secretion system protein n=1 Tax=Romboutsia timonensis TaxID=1776391 RepID=UPI00266C846E|nr:fused FliR family export protein/FlhB family type III secretion system protein [Romboutsia timonensis]MEE0710680.1 fused FliR family export protein/FlhB family type III secretion system protein [Romboutsia timonensis]
MIFVFIRILTFLGCINVIFPSGTPKVFKVMFSIFISFIISPFIQADIAVHSLSQLIIYALMETLTGLVFGFITNMCFNSLKIAGSLIDQQLGLSMASIYDPNTNTQNTLIETILYWLGVMIFFSMNGHHQLIAGIQNSFNLVKVGQLILSGNFDYVINVFVQCFIIGIKIAVPMILSLLIAELLIGFISKSVPQLNVMVVSMPLKLLMGIIFIMIALPFLINKMHHLFNQIPSILDGTLSMNSDAISNIGTVGFLLSMSDKTEEPTPKKKKDARKQGNIAKSAEVNKAMTFIAILVVIYMMSGSIISELQGFIVNILSGDFSMTMNDNTIKILMFKVMMSFMKIVLPISLIIMVFGILGSLIQTGLFFSMESLKPKFSKLNPLTGLKNMFSMKAIVNLIKSMVVICIMIYLGYSFMSKNFEGIIKSGDIYLPYMFNIVLDLIKSILTSITLAVAVVAALDYGYEKFSHKKGLKMTKQEVKEEYKQMEGDPHIKGKIKQKQRQMANQRMMQAVPSSTVIVTNPTHISIAIRYEQGKDTTPIVVAKGADEVAFRIREIAKSHDIPIIENVPLARLIYKEVDIDQEIPEEMYKAVAEVLVAVYKIKNKYK